MLSGIFSLRPIRIHHLELAWNKPGNGNIALLDDTTSIITSIRDIS